MLWQPDIYLDDEKLTRNRARNRCDDLALQTTAIFAFILLPCIPVVITPFVILGVSFIFSKSNIIALAWERGLILKGRASLGHQLAFQGVIARQTFVLDLSEFLLYVTDVKKTSWAV
ncbi:hypothetical protein I308_104027 [Cryptococcus tetragattii IND107]|uniref:Uncharacterized protein n=1 Tax=Cryptococcus tetragattii IND107 TaxID=1296105 RepID=A0ABR3BP70_9TREE